MKIMTLNTHSYQEENQAEKLDILSDVIMRQSPDIIGLQEINQKADRNILKDNKLVIAQFGIPLKADNYAYLLTKKLLDNGIKYNFVWLGIKRGFKIYDEGLAFLSKYPIDEFDTILLSKTDDEDNWKKRMTLGIKTQEDWFYNIHLGRWDDKEEPFNNQWMTFLRKSKKGFSTWVLGDFNSPAEKRNEGYDLVISSGLFDSYLLAKEKDSGITVSGKIDGWRDKNIKKERIDFIFTDKKIDISKSSVIFNNINEKQVSDHFGILLKI